MMRIDECELYVVFRSVVAPFLLDVIHSKHDAASKSNKVSPPGAARRYAPPADGSSTVAKIAADLRPSADGSTVRTSLVAGGG